MQRIAALAGVFALLTLAATPASAGVQMVSGVIVPVLGVPIDASGNGSSASRDGMTVTTERRGAQLVITVVAAN